ncbi:hypothetical protein M0R45_028048 [Rubus argutus]|uniref:CCHC-type domain-containing protein n=1 Tax=Rubus argutus TaxID=59490 RepID=A0AAW1W3F9_RUBAR
MSSFVVTKPANLDEIFFKLYVPKSDLHNSASELDLDADLETEKQIFKYLSAPERYAKMRCPICDINNDGQCCHFVQERGTIPALKICIKCGKVGEHRSWECPNVALRSDTAINDNCPTPESKSEGAAANVPHQNQNQKAQLRRPAPESEGAAAKRPALEPRIKGRIC